VPPRLYGGIERVIALLVDGLHRRGHAVTLFANRSSSVPCDLVPYPSRPSGSCAETLANTSLIARETLSRRPDVVQSFSRLAYLLPILPLSVPKVMSYQREITRRTVSRAVRLSRGSLTCTGCSRHLVEPVSGIGRWRVIYNAVPIDLLRFEAAAVPEAPFVFLGRIERIKGTHLAIDVARRAGRRLHIAGNVPDDPVHRAYFRDEIQPRLDGDAVKYLGPVDDRAKSDLLGGASALLMPVLWDEPFGIVMAEALACGTPVIGLRRGAVPEVVDHGVTGFVCDDVDGMVAAAAEVGRLSRDACRRAAEVRFSQAALVDAYEKIFRELLHAPTV
jgi:glycosyltransferase involved in cell wall biosynthesis